MKTQLFSEVSHPLKLTAIIAALLENSNNEGKVTITPGNLEKNAINILKTWYAKQEYELSWKPRPFNGHIKDFYLAELVDAQLLELSTCRKKGSLVYIISFKEFSLLTTERAKILNSTDEVKQLSYFDLALAIAMNMEYVFADISMPNQYNKTQLTTEDMKKPEITPKTKSFRRWKETQKDNKKPKIKPTTASNSETLEIIRPQPIQFFPPPLLDKKAISQAIFQEFQSDLVALSQENLIKTFSNIEKSSLAKGVSSELCRDDPLAAQIACYLFRKHSAIENINPFETTQFFKDLRDIIVESIVNRVDTNQLNGSP